MEDNPGEVLIVLLETEVSMENVSRLAGSRGYSVSVGEDADGYTLTLTPSGK